MFENLNIIQLKKIHDTIRLGSDHLKKIMKSGHFCLLLNFSQLDEIQSKALAADKTEKIGNVILMINTFLTSIYGTWLGLSGCIGCSLNSLPALTLVTSMAFLTGGIMGYISLKNTKSQASQAMIKLKLLNLQLKMSQMINKRIDCKIEQNMKTLFHLVEFESIKESAKTIRITSETAWIGHLKQILKRRITQPQYVSVISEIRKINKTINKIFSKFYHSLKKKNPKSLLANPLQNMLFFQFPFLKDLANPTLAISKTEKGRPDPINKKNLREIFLGLVPTLVGGFSSLFVFIGGIPDIAKAIGLTQLSHFLTQPKMRTIELMLAVIIAIYFGYSNFHSIQKNKQRNKLLDEVNKKIAIDDCISLEKTEKLKVMLKIKAQIQKINFISDQLKKMDLRLIMDNPPKNNSETKNSLSKL